MEEKYAREEQLILEVESHPILYDKSRPDYKIRGATDKAWHEVALVMGEDEHVVRKKWKNLRDTFRAKYRENVGKRSGTKGGRKKEWVFYRKMSFLINYIEISGTETNYASEDNSKENASQHSIDTNEQSIDLTEDDRRMIENSQEDVDLCDKFPVPATKLRKLEEKSREHVGNRILKALENMEKDDQTEKQSSIRQFFNSLATKAESLSEYDQHILEVSCLQVYSSLKSPVPSTSDV